MLIKQPVGIGFKDEKDEKTIFVKSTFHRTTQLDSTKVMETDEEFIKRKKDNYIQALRRLINMKLNVDQQGYVFFNEFFY